MRLLILDRDGVINEDSVHHIKSPAEWRPLPGSLEAIVRLNQAGWRIVVATNQSGLARGLFDIQTLANIHAKMHRAIAAMGGSIEGVFFCPHGPDDGCRCRKPKPGLFQDIAARLGVDLTGVPAVGDSLRDIQAARAAGARPILVCTGNGATVLSEDIVGVESYADLAAVADALLLSPHPR